MHLVEVLWTFSQAVGTSVVGNVSQGSIHRQWMLEASAGRGQAVLRQVESVGWVDSVSGVLT